MYINDARHVFSGSRKVLKHLRTILLLAATVYRSDFAASRSPHFKALSRPYAHKMKLFEFNFVVRVANRNISTAADLLMKPLLHLTRKPPLVINYLLNKKP